MTDSLDQLVDAARVGCCGDAQWRGHSCQYHQGLEDGVDLVREHLMMHENKRVQAMNEVDILWTTDPPTPSPCRDLLRAADAAVGLREDA